MFNYRENLETASTLIAQAHHTYDNILKELKSDGILWGDITKYLIDNHLSENWPTKTNKAGVTSPVGIRKAIDLGCIEAVWLNRFSVYRNKFEDYGLLKAIAKAEAKAKAEAEEENETDNTPVLVDKTDYALHMRATLEKINNDIETTKNADRKDDLMLLSELLQQLYNL